MLPKEIAQIIFRHLSYAFPRLQWGNFCLTSPATIDYNCIAWAAEDKSRWWWPDAEQTLYWPSGIERNESLSAFYAAFSTCGYSVCANGDAEEGFQKIAFYGDGTDVKHAARQLESGRWTSKLGPEVDIEHGLEDLEGGGYGDVIGFMKRPHP